MKARADQVDLRQVNQAIDELADEVERRGAEEAWVAPRADLMLAALLELARLRAGYADPESLADDERLARAKASGASIEELRDRSGLSKSQVYRRVTRVASLMRLFPATTRRRGGAAK